MEAEKKRLTLIYSVSILGLMLFLLILYAALQRARKKAREKELLELQLRQDKEILLTNLEKKGLELTAKQIELSEKETRINNILSEIKTGMADISDNEKKNLYKKLTLVIGGKSRS